MTRNAVHRTRLACATFVFAMTALWGISKANAGPLKVISTPPNAQIYVDDKADGIKGYTPGTVRVKRGTHKIILEKEGYKPLEHFMDIKPRRQTVSLTLEKIPDTAKIHFVSDAAIADAEVSVDGEAKGKLKDELEIPSGRHLIEVKKDGFQKWSRWFDLQQAEKRDVEVKLEEDLGNVNVVAQPAVKDSFVYINEENKGPAPWSGKLRPGQYTVNVKAPGFSGSAQTVLVETGKKNDVTINLNDDTKTGKLSVAAEPAVANAQVYIDDVAKGPSPWSGVLPSGHHKVEVKAPDYTCPAETIFVEGNKQNIVTVKLYAIAKLDVTVNIGKAEVFIDESSIGFTPLNDVDIPARRSTLYVRQEGYSEYKEVIFPKQGEKVRIDAVLDYAEVDGMNNYLTLKATFGLFGPSKLSSTDISGIDEESTNYKPADTKMSLALGYTHLFAPYVGLGVHTSFTYKGLGGDLSLDLDPMLRFQVPVKSKGRRIADLYFAGGGGLTTYINKKDPRRDDVYELGVTGVTDEMAVGKRDKRLSYGWNVISLIGVQFNVTNLIGLFIEGGWTMHKIYGKNTDSDKFAFMWMELYGGAGIALIF
ncbi:MAG: PEGA domain-containing protein [Deltaproteobacteria bacterium]|nr:PEGA domain-containing protein [Deltaproteobacteria bacterium]